MSAIVSRGIPTKYDGLNFRSRLEAKWAHFFDSLGWEWEYEPIDLKGYIPDFVIKFPYRPLLVEVKPVFGFDDLRDYTHKIERSGWDKESIIVGATLFKSNVFRSLPVVGLFFDTEWSNRYYFSEILSFWKDATNKTQWIPNATN